MTALTTGTVPVAARLDSPMAERRREVRDQALATANTTLFFLIAILSVATVSYMLGGAVSAYWYVAGLAGAGAHAWWNVRHYFATRHLFHWTVVSAAALALVLLSLFSAGLLREYSSDGQTYHANARLELIDGLNPVRDIAADDRIRDFPPASWIWGATIYEVTGRLDNSRAVNLMLLVVCLVYAYSAFSTIAPQLRARNALFAGVITFNPIVITQSFSFMVDGLMASLVAILLCQALLLRVRREWPLLLALGATVIMASNLKLTGVFYAVAIGGGLTAWAIVWDRVVPFIRGRNRASNGRQPSLGDLFRSLDRHDVRQASVLAASLAAAVLFFGYSSYVRTFIRAGTLLDVVGNDLEGWLRAHPGNIPDNWLDLNPTERLVASVFSASRLGAGEAHVKVPFTVTPDEIETFYTGDNRVGGLGPMFGGALLLSLALVLAAGRRAWKGDRIAIDLLFVVVLIAGSVVINPLAWHARYAPQLWSIPVLVAWCSLRLWPASRVVVAAVFLLSVSLVTNVNLVAASYVSQQVNATREINRHLADLRSSAGARVAGLNLRHAFRGYLREEGIRHTPVAAPAELQPGQVVQVPYFGGEVSYSLEARERLSTTTQEEGRTDEHERSDHGTPQD